jgi:Putative transposase
MCRSRAGVTSKWKDYRSKGPDRFKVMTLDTHEFIRRFLIHVLPRGFHRIRYYGLLASGARADNIVRARELLAMPPRASEPDTTETTKGDDPPTLDYPCSCCGGRMIIIEIFERRSAPRYRPRAPADSIRFDTS